MFSDVGLTDRNVLEYAAWVWCASGRVVARGG